MPPRIHAEPNLETAHRATVAPRDKRWRGMIGPEIRPFERVVAGANRSESFDNERLDIGQSRIRGPDRFPGTGATGARAATKVVWWTA